MAGEAWLKRAGEAHRAAICGEPSYLGGSGGFVKLDGQQLHPHLPPKSSRHVVHYSKRLCLPRAWQGGGCGECWRAASQLRL